jgi:hypothetical protein
MDAGIVVFDPAPTSGKGTYLEPNLSAVEVQALLVNSTPVIADGELLTNAAPAKPIRGSALRIARGEAGNRLVDRCLGTLAA